MWEWKRRRDAVRLARLHALRRLLRAWHGLIRHPIATHDAFQSRRSDSAAAASCGMQPPPSEAALDLATAAPETQAAVLQQTAGHRWQEEPAAAAVKDRAPGEAVRMKRRLLRVFRSWRGAAAALQAARARLAEFKRRQKRLCAAAALHTWRSRKRLLVGLRRMRAAAAAQRLQACFAAWRARAAALSAARARTRRRWMRHALLAWRAVTAEERQLRATERAVQDLLTRRRLATVFDALRAAAQHAQQQTAAAAAAAARLRDRAAGAAFAEWKGAAEAVRERELAADARAISAAIGRTAAVLGAWRQAAATARRATAAADKLAERCQRRMLHAFVFAWHGAASAGSFERQQAGDFFLRSVLARVTKRAFAAWLEEMEDSRTATASADHLAEQLQARRMRAGFAAWRVANATLAHKRSGALGRFVQAAAGARLCAAFAAWARFARDTAAARNVAAAMLMCRRKRGLRAAFAAWRVANITFAHERWAALESFLAQMAAGRTATALRAWRSCAAAAKAAAAAAEELGQQSRRRALRGAFAAWRVANATFVHERTAALQCFTDQASDSRLRGVLAMWRLGVLRSRAAAAAARQLAGRVRQSEMRRALAAWRAESAAGSLRETAVIDGLRGEAARKLTGKAFLAWRQTAGRMQEAAAAEALAAAARLQELRAAFQQWRLSRKCRAHERAALIESSAELATDYRLATSMRAWRRVAATAAGVTHPRLKPHKIRVKG